MSRARTPNPAATAGEDSDVVLMRRFNRQGIEAFRAWLDERRAAPGEDLGSPEHLLFDDRLSDALDPARSINSAPVHTKRQAAERLDAAVGDLGAQALRHDAGLWTWLSALFFRSIVGERGGRRMVFNDYYYVFEPEHSHHYYRCLLFVSWWVRHETTRVARDAPAPDRLLLDTAINSLDTVTTEVMKRLYLLRIPAIFEVLDRLYWDEHLARPKRNVAGMGAPRPGDLSHRLPQRIRQLEKTFDLHSLNADAILNLLGMEFESWWKPTLFDGQRHSR